MTRKERVKAAMNHQKTDIVPDLIDIGVNMITPLQAEAPENMLAFIDEAQKPLILN